MAIFQMGEMVQGGAVTLYKLPRTDDRGLCFKESGQELSESLCPAEDGQRIYGIPVGIHCAAMAKLLMQLWLPVGLVGERDVWDFSGRQSLEVPFNSHKCEVTCLHFQK